jgi:hypothetical protein
MATALYGPAGFFVRPGAGPAGHFRTSAHASPLFAAAIAVLLERLDRALGHPDPLDVVDIGAGRGELLSALAAAVPAPLAARLRPIAVELSPPVAEARPPEVGLPGARLPGVAAPEGGGGSRRPAPPPLAWRAAPPERITGLLLATEWLDNVPVDVAEVDGTGVARYVLVDPATGEEALGEPVTGADSRWLRRWWPLSVPGARAEIGRSRDQAWAVAVAGLRRGAALAVDYGHLAADRPPLGTLTGFRAGREVPPLPDGSCDLTAHVAVDAVAAAGRGCAGWGPAPAADPSARDPALGPFALLTDTQPALALHPHTQQALALLTDTQPEVTGCADVSRAGETPFDRCVSVCRAKGAAPPPAPAPAPAPPPAPTTVPVPAPPPEPLLRRQAEALRALGVDGRRPPLESAHRDPAGYLRRLAAAGAAAELADPAGLGGHYWLLQPVAIVDDVTGWLA